MYKFKEPHTAFNGFSEFYDSELRLSLIRGTRNITTLWNTPDWAMTKSGHSYVMIVLTAFVIAGLAFVISSLTVMPFFLNVFLLTIFGGLAYALLDANKYPLDLMPEDMIISKIAEFLDLKYQSETVPSLQLWRIMGLLPDYRKRSNTFRYELNGTYKDADIQILYVKASGTSENRNYVVGETVTVETGEIVEFDGHLIRLEMPKSFSGRTVVLQDQGPGQPKLIQDLKRVGLVDSRFEKAFEVYGSDQVESRALLSPDLMEEMLHLAEVTQSRSIQFGFIASQLLISLSHPLQLFDTRHIHESDHYFEEITQLFINEIGAIFDILDVILRK